MKNLSIILLFFLTACTISPSTPATTIIITPVTTIIITPSHNTSTQTKPSSTEPPYPRLGMWWPDLNEQPLEKVTRYDWVILGQWQTDFLESLGEMNPHTRLLISTSASEVGFSPNDPNVNKYLQAIPPEWYLTQLGTSLREDINESQTSIPVTAVKLGNIDLFLAGDAALIDGESVYVENVDETTMTLTVRRGYIRPATSHAKGTRIAAHISLWPNSWLLNVSTLSPQSVASSEIGPERWVDYNARFGAQLVADSRWAGIFVDRFGQNQSWIIGNSTARSIDPDQSNHLLTDYSAFDAAWNEGLLLYLDKLRAAIGPDRIIFLNGGIPQYTSVNGSDFEGFPNNKDAFSWHTHMFGPNPTGSYFDWMAISRQPNLTTIETYEDNSYPSLNKTIEHNDCNNPTFNPNYRKMRFGLTSALLNDGYFSYGYSTQGPGSCLMWFDEYDNAGFERGYLGYPIGNAQRLVTALTTPNLIQHGKFETNEDFEAWLTLSKENGSVSANPDPSNPATGTFSAHLESIQTSGGDRQATFSYAPIPVIKDKEYTLSFFARSEKSHVISVWAEQDSKPWNHRLNFGEFSLTKEWQKFELPVTAEASDQQARLVFGLGSDSVTVWLDEITLQEGNPDLWRRDYDHGIVIVNATANIATFPLENTYMKINGSQDRSVNDGHQVEEVTIAPYDGIILLRQK